MCEVGTCELSGEQGRSLPAPWSTEAEMPQRGPEARAGLAEVGDGSGEVCIGDGVLTRRGSCTQVHAGPSPLGSETLLAWRRGMGLASRRVLCALLGHVLCVPVV